jgi:ribosomal protein L29
MKTRELNKLRKESYDSLAKMADDKRKEIVLNYSDRVAGKEKNLRKVKLLRRDLAQILTIMREKEIVELAKKSKK